MKTDLKPLVYPFLRIYDAISLEIPADEGDERLDGSSMIAEMVEAGRESAVIEVRSELLLEIIEICSQRTCVDNRPLT